MEATPPVLLLLLALALAAPQAAESLADPTRFLAVALVAAPQAGEGAMPPAALDLKPGASVTLACPCPPQSVAFAGRLHVDWDPQAVAPFDVVASLGEAGTAGALPSGADVASDATQPGTRPSRTVQLPHGALVDVLPGMVVRLDRAQGEVAVTRLAVATAGGSTAAGWTSATGAGAAAGARIPDEDRALPNLVAVVPTHLGEPVADARRPGVGCLADDNLGGATRCLRLTTAIVNDGPADLVLRYDGVASMEQELGNTSRPVGSGLYHTVHGHVHYQDLVAFDIYPVAADGTRGPQVAAGGKTGFCLVDWGLVAGLEPAPRRFWRADCDRPGELRMGIVSGRFDVYRWFLPEQAVDVGHLPDGAYELVVRVDPLGMLQQEIRLDDEASVRFELEGHRVVRTFGERGAYQLVPQ